ncbi:MAG: methyltransferase domain-containing protein [Nitriliruptorales bacterium]|nr:methyltransferase domain-containing protein [Nitriliruptorales bacterium]
MSDPQPPGLPSRAAAYRVVRRVHAEDAWSPRAVDRVLRRSDLDARDRSFAANLAYETLRWEGTLDWALSRVVTRPLPAVQPEVLDVLRLGAWQLLYGVSPDRSAVGTAVDLARAEIGPQVTGFVNGVLRGLARERSRLRWPPADSDEGLGLKLAYPAWVVNEARAVFGGRTGAVLAAGNEAPGLTLRVVPHAERAARDPAGVLEARDALVDELRAAGLEASAGARAPESVRVPGGDPGVIPAVTEGRATPQDEASMLVVRALTWAVRASASPPGGAADIGGLLAGRRVLDACAAPGGKTTHLAVFGAEVTANDLHAGRSRMVGEAAERLGLSDRVTVTTGDAAALPLPPASFDAVLLDVPCTGLGVVRRRPELRWRRGPEDPARLGELQGRLLEAVARLVRPGGVLVYSACTWPMAETRDVIRLFLAIEGDRFSPIDVTPALGGSGTPVPGGHGIQLDPDRDDVDAMYLCALHRSSDAPRA